MIKTVFTPGGGAPTDVFLIDDEPDWNEGVSAMVELVSDTETGLTNREARRKHASSFRWKLDYKAIVQGADARKLAEALRQLTDEPVLLPLWPVKVRWSDYGGRKFGGGLNVVWTEEDFGGTYALFETGSEPAGRDANDWAAPVLWGRLESRKGEWWRPDVVMPEIDFAEAGPIDYATSVAAIAFAGGPVPSGAYVTAPRLLPIGINFDAQTETWEVGVLRAQIGFGRDTATTFYGQATARTSESGLLMPSSEGTNNLATLLEFFRQHGGGKSFWGPSNVSAIELTQDVGAGDTVLHVADTGGVEIGDFLAFFNGTEDVPSNTAVIANKTADTITIAGALGVARPAANTLVCALLLARFETPSIDFTWKAPEIVEGRLPLRELPAEYDPAADETLGVTIGEMPERCYLYEVTRNLGGTVFTERWTSYEQDLTYGGHTYSARKVSHGDIFQGLYLDDDKVDFICDFREATAGGGANPLKELAQLQSEARIFVTIYRGDVDAGAAINVEQIFYGEIVKGPVAGSQMTATLAPGGSIFDRMVPTFLVQRDDNFGLFTVGNGLLKANWKWTAKIANAGTPGYPFQFDLTDLARAVGADPPAGGYSANWFASGWIELNAAPGGVPPGIDFQRRQIILSTNPAVVGGHLTMTVTLDRDPDPFPAVNDAVVLYPGYDMSFTTAGAKLLNIDNFGGHPFLPLGNPMVVKQRQSTPSSKK